MPLGASSAFFRLWRDGIIQIVFWGGWEKVVWVLKISMSFLMKQVTKIVTAKLTKYGKTISKSSLEKNKRKGSGLSARAVLPFRRLLWLQRAIVFLTEAPTLGNGLPEKEYTMPSLDKPSKTATCPWTFAKSVCYLWSARAQICLIGLKFEYLVLWRGLSFLVWGKRGIIYTTAQNLWNSEPSITWKGVSILKRFLKMLPVAGTKRNGFLSANGGAGPDADKYALLG